MAVPGVAPHTGIRPGETDARTVERIDGADVNTVRADDFHSRLHAFNP
jgi:hypothetical protein